MDFNHVVIVGRVTANPELRTTPGGQSVTTLGVATNRTWTDKAGARQEEVEFHNVVLWGKQAEVATQFIQKGSLVLVEGRLRTRAWTDKDGHQRKATEIVGEHIQLGPKSQGEKVEKRERPADIHVPPEDRVAYESEEIDTSEVPF